MLGALLLALVVGFWAARRVSSLVLAPLISVCDRVVLLRNGKGARTRELRDLAHTVEQLKSSLHRSLLLLHDQAYTDTLTGLPNRRAVVERLVECADDPVAPGASLLLIDLDDFKFVNDTFGQEAGDQLLRMVAVRLRETVPDGGMVARLGGDQFALIINEGHDPATAIAVADMILGTLGEPVAVNGALLAAHCSIGIAHTTGDRATASELLVKAEMAMSMAKSRGKHRCELYSRTAHASMVAQMGLRTDLAGAARHDQLVVHYQPVVDLTDSSILGWEALVRWQHPHRGLVPPAEFIPLAEETGDILSIGTWVLERACRDFAQALRPGHPARWFSVNVSPHQLGHPHFAQTVRDTLERWDIDPRSLVIEITEEALLTDTATAAETLAALRREGVRFALDDFGTGFSSLRYLHQLPIDIIKIDRSFIASRGTGRPDMLEAIVSLGRDLRLDMIVEGIEDTSELERVKRNQGLAGQGYHFARPMPLAEAAAESFVNAAARPPTTAELVPCGHPRAQSPRVSSTEQ